MKKAVKTKTPTLSTQSKFMQLIHAKAEKLGLQFINNKAWANTGTVRFEKAGSFSPLLVFSYSFQDSYASFDGDIKNSHTVYNNLDLIVAEISRRLKVK